MASRMDNKQQGHNDQSMDYLLFYCEKTSTQRDVVTHQMNQQLNWMKIEQDLIS